MTTKEGLLIFGAFCGWMICCLWCGTGDVVVVEKRREGEAAVAEKRKSDKEEKMTLEEKE